MPDAAFHIRDNHASTELAVTVDGTEIATYVYRPDTPREESPKPYLYPLRTLSGAPLGAFRPWDHRWHKGLQMTWSHLSGQNFWGGPSFESGAPGHGYVWRDNNGSQLHRGFDRLDADGAEATVTERLDWVAATGESLAGRTAYPAIPQRRHPAGDLGAGLRHRADEHAHRDPRTRQPHHPWPAQRRIHRPVLARPARLHRRTDHRRRRARTTRSWVRSAHGPRSAASTTRSTAAQRSWPTRAAPRPTCRSSGSPAATRSPASIPRLPSTPRSSSNPGAALELRHRFVFLDNVTDRAGLEPIAREYAP